MASATLNHFPIDTDVTVHEKTGDSFDGGGCGKALGTVNTGADGAAVVAGLEEGVEYWASTDMLVLPFHASEPDPEDVKPLGSPKAKKAAKAAGKPKAVRGARSSTSKR